MVYQAYVDDSHDDDYFILGGFVAKPDTWARFSKEWEAILDFAMIGPNGKHIFKMSEMVDNQRMDIVPAFYRIIESHDLVALSCRIRISDIQKAKDRISVPYTWIRWDNFTSPYLIAVLSLMDNFQRNREVFSEEIPKEEKIEFIFDDQSEKRIILSMWDDYLARRPEHHGKFWAKPRFEDDSKCVPLQAADFLAWWVRKWASEGRGPTYFEFPWRRKEGRVKWIGIEITEEHLVDALKMAIICELPNDRFVQDSGPSRGSDSEAASDAPQRPGRGSWLQALWRKHLSV